MKKVVDARGRLCPEPLVMTKREIKAAAEGDRIEVLLDNDTSRCNVEAFLAEMGIKSNCTNRGGLITIAFVLGADTTPDLLSNNDLPNKCTPRPSASRDYVVVIRGETMGEGEHELGTMLMRACINSLSDLDVLPSYVILYNGGVKLAVRETDTARGLEKLTAKGVEIVLCGTCTDYYELTDSLAVGTVSNMYRINSILAAADHVIYP